MADFDLDNTSGENTKSIDFFSYYRNRVFNLFG